MSPRRLAAVVVLASAGLALTACATAHCAAGAADSAEVLRIAVVAIKGAGPASAHHPGH